MPSTLSLVLPDREGMVLPNGRLHPDFRRYLLNLGQVASSYSDLAGDHGDIPGLGDNDHPQYALVAALDGLQRHENGFVDRTDSAISFTSGTRTFQIAPTGVSFDYFHNATRYTVSSADTVQIADAEGLHYIYYNGPTLSVTTTFTEAIITDYAFVCAIYWDATNSQAVFIGDERHGSTMDSMTHVYNHRTFGARYGEGLTIGNMDVDGSGNDASAAQMSVSDGVIWDEDIEVIITDGSPQELSLIAQIPMFYRSGASGAWRKIAATGYPVTTAGTGMAAWNEYTGATWQLTEAGNNNYVLSHLYATADIENPIIGIVGQAVYSTVGDARAGADVEIASLAMDQVGSLTPEFVPIATVIFQTASAYSNAVKSRVRSTESGDDYVDWRTQRGGVGGVAGNFEPALGNPAADGYVLSSTAAGARSWVAQAGGGAAAPYCHLTKSGTQDVGGANGTVTYIDWDGTQINVDTGFTHSTGTNPSRVQVDADGRYQLIATVGIEQGGSARTTSMIEYRVNGTTIVTRGRARNYSRGSGYGDASCNLVTEMDLSNGDYIEVSITVDDSDGAYTNNTINAECELILRKVA